MARAPAPTSYPKDKIRVVLLEGIHPRAVALLRSEGFLVESVAGSPSPERLHKLLAEAHVLGIRSKTRLTGELLHDAPRLLAVGCFCIGTDQVDLAAARTLGVPVFNAPYSNTRSVAELTIAEIIALSRRLCVKSEQMHRGTWDKSSLDAREVRGRTLGIVGYGHIGSQVSVLAEALGMRVVFHDVVQKLALGNARPLKTLGELLRESDFVTLHVPATPQTKGLIGTRQLAMMRPGATLINNARGKVVDLDALAHAIASGHLAGAALDVFPEEPAGNGDAFASPLIGMPNVILTPHIGGSTEEALAAIAEDVSTALAQFINVGTTTGSVNVPQVDPPPQAGEPGGRPHRILHFHRNVPGVLHAIHTRISGAGGNISAEFLRTHEDVGYVVMDVDSQTSTRVLKELKSVPETIRSRILW